MVCSLFLILGSFLDLLIFKMYMILKYRKINVTNCSYVLVLHISFNSHHIKLRYSN